MSEPSFTLARLPHIELGAGRLALLPDTIARHGRQVLLVTGRRSFRTTDRWPWLLAELEARGVGIDELAVGGEPSPDLVDGAVARFGGSGIDVVAGIGGGSVLDAAKAIAGLLIPGNSVRDHLEGVGPELPYLGPAVPLVAVPTTAGTGSEATKNAVLSERGPNGYKRSFRDERLVAAETIVDPDLLVGCPPELIAADGMDAVTQLLESYVSQRAGPVTDPLALAGLEAAGNGLLAWHGGVVSGDAPEATARSRVRMALAALLSGVCLANAGLGVVHGIASPLGAHFPIPHGAACGAVLTAGVEANIAALERRAHDGPALARYATIGRLLAGLPAATSDNEARHALVAELRRWTTELGVAGLSAFGVTERDIPAIVAGSRGSSMRTNPIELTDEEIAEVIRASL